MFAYAHKSKLSGYAVQRNQDTFQLKQIRLPSAAAMLVYFSKPTCYPSTIEI